MHDCAIMWDWLAFAGRWLHVITAIAWIGSSFYFIALDLGLHRDRNLASGADGARQLAVARTMQRLADAVDVRFVVGLGDSIYHGPAGRQDATGAYDEDWWLTFFQPYRYLWDHLAFYPTAGNHDSSDTEASDDREQLAEPARGRVLWVARPAG